MRIGFATIYSWRPHVEHAYFLANLVERAGHEAHFLTCDADLPTCYTRQLRDTAAWRECLQCRVGGIRSYTGRHIDSIGLLAPADHAATPLEWAQSSASTLGRFESDADYTSPRFNELTQALLPATQLGYQAARAWIRARKLDAVCVFNGRMDVTRGIFEAARSLGVKVASLERTWFSHGLQIYPEETCMGLRSVHKLVGAWRDKPLRAHQALLAASYAAARFLRRNDTEWRAYNVSGTGSEWPAPGGRHRILLVPSSRNEVWGHAEWTSMWGDPINAYDALIEHLRLQPADLVLRCHPNWAEKIGRQGGELAEEHYTAWAARRGVCTVGSRDKTSTSSLVEQCDAIVVANGSTALEAGMLGKQVIAVAPSIYKAAGFRDDAESPASLAKLKLHADLESATRSRRRETISRLTMRFAYTMMHRIPQYVRQVRAASPTKYSYDMSADPRRFIDLLVSGELRADDEDYDATSQEEDTVLQRVARRDWQGLLDDRPADAACLSQLSRRLLFRSIDGIRQRLPVGDR
jgi:hypothetical protein